MSQAQQSAALEVAPGPAWGAPEKHAQSLANVQQEQHHQQQQQQEQRNLDWDAAVQEAVVSKPAEPKPAPWAGVKPPLPGMLSPNACLYPVFVFGSPTCSSCSLRFGTHLAV